MHWRITDNDLLKRQKEHIESIERNLAITIKEYHPSACAHNRCTRVRRYWRSE